MIPFHNWFTVVKLGEPIWGIVLSVVISLVLGLVQFGPAAAFNSLLGGATVFSFISYSRLYPFRHRAGLRNSYPLFVHAVGRSTEVEQDGSEPTTQSRSMGSGV